MEYWIVYDRATGAERWRGSGPPGSAVLQNLPEELGVVIVPQEVIAGAEPDLAALRSAVASYVDAAAEQRRQRFLTPGAGQAMTYTRKEAEARAWQVDTATPVPFLTAEAGARGIGVADLATEVIAMADAWTTIGAAIEAIRMGAKAAIGAASSIGAIVTAAQADWSAIDAQAAA